jgi:hypothetical protein
MAVAVYIYMFARPNLGHWPAFGIAAAFCIAWFVAVITWMGRQWNEWYSR